MEISSEVLPLLGPGLTKRAGSSIPANPIQTLVEALEMLRLAKYFIVAVITFLVYDIVLTYSREVRLVWGSRWTLVRVLFTIARYLVPCILIMNLLFTFHPNLSAQVCRIEIRMMAALGIFANSIMMCILLLRVWALWGRKPRMLIALLLVFASSQLPPALLVGKTIQKLEVIDNPLPGLLTGCVTTSSSSASAHWVQLFISSLTYESTLFLLTLVRAWSLNRRGAGTPIMTLMTRDGAWYFLVVIVSVGLTALGTSIRRTQMAALLSQFFVAMISCTCCRLLLRLRGFYTPADQSTRYEGTAQGQHNEISLQPYTPRKNDYLTTLATSATSFDRMFLKPPV